jgi:hypothetical protein
MVTLGIATLTFGAGVLIAEQQQFASDPTSMLLGYGPLGLVVIGFLTGWLVPGTQLKKSEAETARLQRLFDDQVFPMAQTYASTMAQATVVLHDVTEELRRTAER